ncbi:MAG: cytochrome c, partial [Verrucomicrobiota bacterium]|nr:cytochrome c [Verrucomicrobiota bacterium]
MRLGSQPILLVALVWPSAWPSGEDTPALQDGLAVAFQSVSGGLPDHTVRPHFMLYVPVGESPSPFVAPGPFTAVWKGMIHLDLRDRFIFQAELNGSLKLELNDKPVMEVTATGEMTEPTKRIRLNSRGNTFKATFTSPEKGDAFFRLYWSTPDYGNEPIPPRHLKHTPNENLAKGAELRRGRQLASKYRCFKCHTTNLARKGMPELAMDAPAFDGIGSRRDAGWMADWILKPVNFRQRATMPALLHGGTAEADATAIASFLSRQKADEAIPGVNADAATAETGRKLFTQLNCAACHTMVGDPSVAAKVELGQVRWKFGKAGLLAAFLKNPQAHYRWNRMPDFALEPEEAAALAVYLFQSAGLAEHNPLSATPSVIARGRKLIQSTGCLNCHALELENQFNAPAIADLASGCLAGKPTGAPGFAFGEGDREALRLFLREGRVSLGQSSLAEFTLRQSANLNCANCHGQMELIPPFDVLGGKLKPEWSGKILAGAFAKRQRPWQSARMPAFPAQADGLAKGLALLHGRPPVTLPDVPVDAGKAAIGRKLVSSNGGFFCFSCHGIGELEPAQVFDAQGINLARVGDRLLPEYFRRWMRNPLRIDPQTK